MTPKDKAKELVDKYFLLHESGTDEKGVWFISALNKGMAKKCALIVVDEILNITYQQDELIWLDDYYTKVKQEILAV